MYFTLSPFFYYIAHSSDILNFIVIHTDGKFPHSHLDKEAIRGLIEKFILLNSHGVDEKSLDKYTDYIYNSIASTYWNP